MFGPRFSYRAYERLTPFFQTLFGATYATPVTISGCTPGTNCTPLGSQNAFGTMLGAGFDIKINHRFALRPFEGDFLLTHFKDPFSSGQALGWQKNVRFSTGIVVRFGGNHPAPPPPSAAIAATCSADKEMVYAGSGDFVAVRAQSSNPDQTPLNYYWSASEGGVDGTGPEVRWNSSDRQPGTYTIKVRVDNGRNGIANCSASIRVEPRPNRPPTHHLLLGPHDRDGRRASGNYRLSQRSRQRPIVFLLERRWPETGRLRIFRDVSDGRSATWALHRNRPSGRWPHRNGRLHGKSSMCRRFSFRRR